jgi:hypothetical protein
MHLQGRTVGWVESKKINRSEDFQYILKMSVLFECQGDR